MAEWQRRFWSTALSGYMGVAIRMVTGLLIFRLMYQELPETHFGFWALLWSIFGYGVLVDFGFGFTAQKAVAEKTTTGDIPGLNRLLSTIFWTYVAIAVGLLALFLLIRAPFLARMGVTSADWEVMTRTYVVFFCGMALLFPTGLFPEILRGLQRFDLANWSGMATAVVGAGTMWWGLKSHWDLSVLMAVSIATSAISPAYALVVSFQKIPGLSLAPRWFEWSAVRSQIGFSSAAYLITFSNMLMSKTDQMVISLTLGVGFIKLYQAGYKMGEMLGMFGGQLQQALSPAAAAMHVSGDEGGLRHLLLENSRLAFLVVTPCYLLSAVYLEPLLHLLTGMEAVNPETFWVGQSLTFTVYSSILTNSCSKRVLMMCGLEKILLKISLVDAISNVVLSLLLAPKFGVLGVALGTMIPTTLVGWFWVIPVTLKHLKLGWWKYLAHHLQGTWLPVGAFCAVLAGVVFFFPAVPDCGLVALGWRGALCLAVVGALGFPVIRNMTKPTGR